MFINTSGTCATTKLIQCRNVGCYEVDISRKFEQDPDQVSDLSRDDFLARKNVLEQVEKWAAENGKGRFDKWVPIAYMYELVKASAKRTKDWGHLLFTDLTTTRFLIVMVFSQPCECGNYLHHDYDAMTKHQADRLVSLLTYLHHDNSPPKWVRATYVTSTNDFALDPEFLGSTAPLSNVEMRDRLAAGRPPLFHVTPDTFVPSLRDSDVEKIDNMKGTQRAAVPDEVRAAVIGGKQTRAHVEPKEKHARQCAFCEEAKERDLMVCSQCKVVHYCGPECQRLAWPMHKPFCKQ